MSDVNWNPYQRIWRLILPLSLLSTTVSLPHASAPRLLLNRAGGDGIHGQVALQRTGLGWDGGVGMEKEGSLDEEGEGCLEVKCSPIVLLERGGGKEIQRVLNYYSCFGIGAQESVYSISVYSISVYSMCFVDRIGEPWSGPPWLTAPRQKKVG